jgi:hypothetical protein
MTRTVKTITTRELTRLIEAAVSNGASQQIAGEIIPRLDPEGMHVITLLSARRDPGESPVPLRTRVLMRVPGEGLLRQAFLDVAPEDWEALCAAPAARP